MQTQSHSTFNISRKLLICMVFFAMLTLPAQAAPLQPGLVFDTVFIPTAQGVTVKASANNIAINRTTSVTLAWTVAFSATPPPSSTSTSGSLFIPQGPLLLTINKALTGTPVAAQPQAPIQGYFTVTENLLIPASVVAKARAAGATQISYSRQFFPGPLFAGAAATFNITGSGSAGFSISREALSFTDE